MEGKYNLPDLPYSYKALEPYISERQLTVHHDKHHKAYVDSANDLLVKIENARKGDEELDMKSVLKSLSWNLGGHILHSLFWKNMAPPDTGCEIPSGHISDAIDDNFGSYERFMKEFTSAAKSVEGSGWAILVYEKNSGKLMILQAEKHNTNIVAGLPVLLVMDMFEHAYYIDHENKKMKYIEGFWNIVNWKEVDRRFERAMALEKEEPKRFV